MSLLNGITTQEIKKIFCNNANKRKYLEHLSEYVSKDFSKLRTNAAIEEAIIRTWNYDLSKKIIRKMFCDSEKCNESKAGKNKINDLICEWKNLNLGKLDWPFLPKLFDNHVNYVNRSNLTEREKDEQIALDAIRFRRIKDINTLRNDYIEYLIYANNDEVIPTFGNSRGVDFYINGQPFDQKVGRSIGKAFIEKYGDEYRKTAIEKPELVAKSLYENQDEERFGCEPRLLVAYLDSDLTTEDVERSLASVDFSCPINIEFEYAFSNGNVQTYKTDCYIVLLHK